MSWYLCIVHRNDKFSMSSLLQQIRNFIYASKTFHPNSIRRFPETRNQTECYTKCTSFFSERRTLLWVYFTIRMCCKFLRYAMYIPTHKLYFSFHKLIFSHTRSHYIIFPLLCPKTTSYLLSDARLHLHRRRQLRKASRRDCGSVTAHTMLQNCSFRT